MMKKSGATALGALFGIFSLLFSFVVLFVLLAPYNSIAVLGTFTSLAVSILNPAINALTSFGNASYIIGLGGFVLAIIAICASGMRKHYIVSGILLLISTIGVFILYYYPLLFGFSGGIIGALIQNGFNFNGVSTEGVILIAIALASVLFTLFGLIGALVSFFPKQPSFGQTYQQPYGAPYQPQYGAPPYQQPQQPQPQQTPAQQPQYQPPVQQPQQPQQQYGQPQQAPPAASTPEPQKTDNN